MVGSPKKKTAKHAFFGIILLILFFSCFKNEGIPNPETGQEQEQQELESFSDISIDAVLTTPFGDLSYRVSFPLEKEDEALVIIIPGGGNGFGEGRGRLLSYVNYYVSKGYVVIQVDHRNAGNDIANIAKLRGRKSIISRKQSRNACWTV
ncbi:hypothetical protein FK220_015180 [Flavobacteriaceae bacterium TP-CH-4]|uniref:Alpha/beta hydrolase family protein n=1 Tax=Pelagihabitans pacificus TaxID=2696054 RepID=A0A967AVH1_9FLAO|nr:hypothetical protein [Pelagihabitans pacificus]NHF60697.1 hypothetical protein [Pelagihabitans pacificus]